MSIDKIIEALNGIAYGKEVALFCAHPRTIQEIRAYYDDYASGDYTRPDISKPVRELEKNGIIQYENEKWVITQEVKKIIDQYF